MSRIYFTSICPHPPIIIPTIGSSSDLKVVAKTIEAMEKLAEIFAKARPDTVIVISPHGPVDFNQFTINESPTLAGHFYNFGDFQTELIFKNDLELIQQIKSKMTYLSHDRQSFKPESLMRTVIQKELDHGTLVPLYYLAKHHPNFKVVPIAFSYLDIETHFKFGQILHKKINGGQSSIAKSQEKKVAIIASGDLSHCLTPGAPGGFSPRGKEFDEKLVELLKNKDTEGILNMPPDLVGEAGECGYRSIVMLLGALNGLSWQPEILSYEGPFGVGYLVVNFKL